MSYIDQKIFACPKRNDGRNAEGMPGDCIRTTVANLTGAPYGGVPHFAMQLNWWSAMRRWARSMGGDFICLLPEDVKRFLSPEDLIIGSGPSPRGDFWHVALYDGKLELVHDPHPSKEGLVSLEECLVLIPYKLTDEPVQLMLTTGVTNAL